MACVCLKNGVDKFWRKTAPHAIGDEERLLLKERFLSYLNEPELKIARQMSVILGKLARFELPLQWPDLISKLLQLLQDTSNKATSPAMSSSSSSSLATNSSPSTATVTYTSNEQKNLINCRCLMALHAIIKSLASKRLLNDRKVFEELALNIIDMLIQLGFFYVQECLVNPIGDVAEASFGNEQTFKQQLQEHSF